MVGFGAAVDHRDVPDTGARIPASNLRPQSLGSLRERVPEARASELATGAAHLEQLVEAKRLDAALGQVVADAVPVQRLHPLHLEEVDAHVQMKPLVREWDSVRNRR